MPGMPEIIRMLKEGMYHEATPLLKEQLARDPNNIQAIACLAASYSQTGMKTEAIREFVHLTELQPDSAVHHFNLGVAYESIDDAIRAKACFEKALALDPANRKAQQRLDVINARTGQAVGYASMSDPLPGPWSTEDTATSPREPVAPPKGFNWGGFFFPFWWSIAHRAWLWSVIAFFFGGIASIVLLIKGNEIAFENRLFRNMKEFRAVQKAWTIWGMAIHGAIFLLIAIYFGTIMTMIMGDVIRSGRGNTNVIPPMPGIQQMPNTQPMPKMQEDSSRIMNGTDSHRPLPADFAGVHREA